VPMLAELVDAVVGVDTHRDTHDVEIALPTGAPIATCTIRNDSRGYASCWHGSSSTRSGREWSPQSRAPARERHSLGR